MFKKLKPLNLVTLFLKDFLWQESK